MRKKKLDLVFVSEPRELYIYLFIHDNYTNTRTLECIFCFVFIISLHLNVFFFYVSLVLHACCCYPMTVSSSAHDPLPSLFVLCRALTVTSSSGSRNFKSIEESNVYTYKKKRPKKVTSFKKCN